MQNVNKSNSEIRKAAAESKVYLWEIAERIGVTETTFVKRLRKELPEDQKKEILTIIGELAAEKAVM